ncbi:MAG TPA: ATP-binding protein, partial [Clostridiales bacterium]|nr:ATP-binding protein [Clostridiales bacterium]
MKFIGRIDELNKLEKQLSTEDLSFSLIYGRRRVGKSELVKQLLKNTDVKSIYFECKQVAEESNVKSLSQVVSEVLYLPKLGYTDIESLLEYIFELSEKEKLILVLDEYPYLRESVKGLDSIVQSVVDKYRECSKCKLIILGSYVEIMKSLLEHSNPLYGRVDLTIHLKQMDYYESAMFYPGFTHEDKVRIYSVFGGIPYYNRLIDDTKSVRENIIDLIASSGARLENEVSGYLSAEISKITNANEVFEALSRGYSKYSDVLSQSHVSSGPTLIDVLDRLIRMEVVEKKAPINDPNNKKKMGYYVSDNLSLFYYRYIFKYLSQLKIMDSEVFYSKYIEKDFEEKYVPQQFENICKQYLIRENKAGRIHPVIEKIGKYYYDNPKQHTNGEFDIV